jgi:hypothetical protein
MGRHGFTVLLAASFTASFTVSSALSSALVSVGVSGSVDYPDSTSFTKY